MRIEVVRSGGFAGIERRAAVETADHPDAARLESLASAALTPSPDEPSTPGVPDGFRYTLTAGPRTLHCAEPHLTPPQRQLITLLLHDPA